MEIFAPLISALQNSVNNNSQQLQFVLTLLISSLAMLAVAWRFLAAPFFNVRRRLDDQDQDQDTLEIVDNNKQIVKRGRFGNASRLIGNTKRGGKKSSAASSSSVTFMDPLVADEKNDASNQRKNRDSKCRASKDDKTTKEKERDYSSGSDDSDTDGCWRRKLSGDKTGQTKNKNSTDDQKTAKDNGDGDDEKKIVLTPVDDDDEHDKCPKSLNLEDFQESMADIGVDPSTMDSIPGKLKKSKFVAINRKIEAGLTDEQKTEEAETRRRQLEQIFQLMMEQQDKLGVQSQEDVAEQMKLYAL